MTSVVRLVLGVLLLLEGVATLVAPESSLLTPSNVAFFRDVPRGIWGPLEILIGVCVVLLALHVRWQRWEVSIMYAAAIIYVVGAGVAASPWLHGEVWSLKNTLAWLGLAAVAAVTVLPDRAKRWIADRFPA